MGHQAQDPESVVYFLTTMAIFYSYITGRHSVGSRVARHRPGFWSVTTCLLSTKIHNGLGQQPPL